MTKLRLAMVTRRFWPLVGGAEVYMGRMANEFRKQGASVTLLTAQWESHWPTHVSYQGIPVVRLNNPPLRAWGTYRYMRALSRWLRVHRQEFDLIYVSMLKHDAYSAIQSLAESSIPVVLRAEGSGKSGDCHWQEDARFGKRIRRQCQRADGIIVPSQEIADELLAAEYAADKIHLLANGVADFVAKQSESRATHRAALGEINHDLLVRENAPVVVYTGRLHHHKGLHTLVDAFRPVAARWPHAKLWLVGDGPERDQLYRQIGDADLRPNVAMPGTFDDVESILHAADLFVLPSHYEGLSLSLLEAMAVGVPVIASDIAGNRELVTHDQTGLLFPVGDTCQLSEHLHTLLQDGDRAAKLVRAARERITKNFSLRDRVIDHLQLFEKLIEQKQQ